MVLSKDLFKQLYYGSVSVKQRLAEEIYESHSAILLMDNLLKLGLEELTDYASQLNAQMTGMNMGELCGQCAAENGGGCCSLYMAGETDGMQMLMNLLVGGELAQVRNDGVECCFLGEKGCIFLCKPMFCLNYNCKKIHDTATAEDMKHLERLTGQLLGKQHEVEQRILQILRSKAL